jgi:hypothetical protein
MQEARGSSPLSSTVQRTKSRLCSSAVNGSGSHPADEALVANWDDEGRLQSVTSPRIGVEESSPFTVTEIPSDASDQGRPGRGGAVHSMDGTGGLSGGPCSRKRVLPVGEEPHTDLPMSGCLLVYYIDGLFNNRLSRKVWRRMLSSQGEETIWKQQRRRR